MFIINNFSVSVDDKLIVKSFSASFESGSTYVLMGPNGSGKSTFVSALMLHPRYKVSVDLILFNKQDISNLPVHERARLGIYLIMQHPIEVPGVSLATLTRESFRALCPTLSLEEYQQRVDHALFLLALPKTFLERSVNEGCSGGEKKLIELFQMLVVRPSFVILDELDSGLDADALHRATHALQWYKKTFPQTIFLIISHYFNLIESLHPDYVFVMNKGIVADQGSAVPLLEKIKQQGYGWLDRV